MTSEPTLLAEHVSAFLESPYKPLLMFISFVAWAWLVSSKLEKDARFFHLNYPLWNAIHMAAAVVALGAMLFIPVFWVGWPLGIALLYVPVHFYWRYRNQNVPVAQQFHLSKDVITTRMETRRRDKAAREAMLEFTDAEDKSRTVPPKDDPLFAVHMMAEDIIGPALDARATMIELAVAQNGCAIAQMIDGVKYKRDPVPADAALKVIDYLKELAGLDVEDRRRQQSGAFEMRGPAGKTELVASTAGSSAGIVLRLEFDRAKRLAKPFDALGMLPAQVEALTHLTQVHERHGIVLVGAPPGHGLSTSMYSLIARHDPYTASLKTLEREIELRIDGVDHARWDPTNPDIDYATNLQSILRRDPDVVMTSYIKDPETAAVISGLGMEGPLIYIPQRAASIAEQVREWVKLVGNVKKATRDLRAVINQRLLRTLCQNCRQAYQPTSDQLKKLSLPPGKVKELYRPGGKIQVRNKIETCPVCGGTGYLGQTGIFEIMPLDDETRRLLSSGDLRAALSHARRNKMIYLQEAALAKVAAGDTTIEEVVRITAPAKADRSADAPPKPEQKASPN